MEASAGLVAGSHNRNELVVIRRDNESAPRPQLSGQICQICGDDVGLTVDGDLFVACKECAFPICRTCYEYERKEGNQVCPQCKTRFKRLKGCARVEGDDEEEDTDDIENEFNYMGRDKQDMQQYLDVKDALTDPLRVCTPSITDYWKPLAEDVDDIPPEHHALVPSFMGGGKRIHPLPFSDPSLPVMRNDNGGKDWDNDGDGPDLPFREALGQWQQS